MSKWKCEICGNDFDNFHAQGFDNMIYCPLCYFKKLSADLQVENESLKKQFEELEESSANAINKQVSKGIDLINQQQKFIKYLENCIKELEKGSLNKLQNVLSLGISDIAKEILRKYKEIIGNDINVGSKGVDKNE